MKGIIEFFKLIFEVGDKKTDRFVIFGVITAIIIIASGVAFLLVKSDLSAIVALFK